MNATLQQKLVVWLHHRMAAAQNLYYKEGDVCVECIEVVKEELVPMIEEGMSADDMLRHVVASLKQYPDGVGDIQVMAEVARIEKAAHTAGMELEKDYQAELDAGEDI